MGPMGCFSLPPMYPSALRGPLSLPISPLPGHYPLARTALDCADPHTLTRGQNLCWVPSRTRTPPVTCVL
jgi:hypothetical protein